MVNRKAKEKKRKSGVKRKKSCLEMIERMENEKCCR